MQIIKSTFLFLLAVVSLESCTQSCVCGRQCYLFNNGAVKICQTSYADSVQFVNSTDSLGRLYGSSYTSVFADSVSVGGSSSNGIDKVAGQLERQGYTCNCIY